MALKTYVLAICSISLVVIGQPRESISLNSSIPICYTSVVEEMNIFASKNKNQFGMATN